MVAGQQARCIHVGSRGHQKSLCHERRRQQGARRPHFVSRRRSRRRFLERRRRKRLFCASRRFVEGSRRRRRGEAPLGQAQSQQRFPPFFGRKAHRLCPRQSRRRSNRAKGK